VVRRFNVYFYLYLMRFARCCSLCFLATVSLLIALRFLITDLHVTKLTAIKLATVVV